MHATLRRKWLAVHRWIGLTIGLLFVLLGLTGSLLVFDHAIDEWLNPTLLLGEAAGPQVPLSDLTRAAEAAYAAAHSEQQFAAAAMVAPRVPNGVWTAWFMSGSESKPEWTMVYVDPSSGRVTGQRVWGTDLMGVVYRLHYTLLGGEFGAVIVGIGGIVLTASVLSGICLWWPLWKNGWRAAFAIRRGRRFAYDLHKSLGVCGAPVVLVIAFTGVYMIFPGLIDPIVNAVSKRTKPVEGITSGASNAATDIGPERAIAIARDVFPNARFDHFHPPQSKDGTYEIGLRQPDEPQTSFGATQVIVDQYSGAVLAVRDPTKLSAGDHFVAWQFPLHNGEAFGLLGRLIVFASGLLPAALYVTGFIMWWRKRKSRVSTIARREITSKDHLVGATRGAIRPVGTP